MSEWRVIITDSESLTGIAPECESEDHAKHAERASGSKSSSMCNWVFDCCPYPQIELHDEVLAAEFAERFTVADAGMAGS